MPFLQNIVEKLIWFLAFWSSVLILWILKILCWGAGLNLIQNVNNSYFIHEFKWWLWTHWEFLITFSPLWHIALPVVAWKLYHLDYCVLNYVYMSCFIPVHLNITLKGMTPNSWFYFTCRKTKWQSNAYFNHPEIFCRYRCELQEFMIADLFIVDST